MRSQTVSEGLGTYTCCSLGHEVGGHAIACDKPKIRHVLELLLTAKLSKLLRQGRTLEYRYYVASRDHFLQGLPLADSQEAPAGLECQEVESEENDAAAVANQVPPGFSAFGLLQPAST